jgi:hypothetical protein
MKKNYLSIIVCALCFSSCAKENMTNSALSIKAVYSKADTGGSSGTEEVNARSAGTENDTVLWCRGNDIEWYNATTSELKLSDNTSHRNIGGKFVIFLYDKELLSFPIGNAFSSYLPADPSIFIFCEAKLKPSGDQMDRMYVGDGKYIPPFDGDYIAEYEYSWRYFINPREPLNLIPEWNIFIEQLKKEGKYRE